MWSRDKLFIANQWVEPSGARQLEVISPTTEEVIGRTPYAEVADIDRAVDAARRAFAVVQVGDPRPYGCFLFRKGVIASSAP